MRSSEIRTQRILNNLTKQKHKLGSDSILNSAQCPEPSVQSVASSIQSPTSRVQRSEFSVQSSTSRVQSTASRLQIPASRVQRAMFDSVFNTPCWPHPRSFFQKTYAPFLYTPYLCHRSIDFRINAAGNKSKWTQKFKNVHNYI